MLTQEKYKLSLILFGIMCCTIGFSCKDKVDLPDQPIDSYSNVYMSQVLNGPVIATLKIKDIVQTATYGAIFGGYGVPEADIPVSFTVDNSMVATYNTANKTNYAILPSTAYTLSATNTVIAKGKTSTDPLSITFKTTGTGAMEALKTYLLPITLSAQGVKLNESLKTAYYIVKAQPDLADYPNYDRASLTVVGFSSQEASGEGPNNGRVVFALDGNTSTFWHTQWKGASPGPPHFAVLDFGTVKTLHGVSFIGRQNDGGGKPEAVNVQVSLDNVTWTDAGSFNLKNNKDLQSEFLPFGFKSARYVKIIVNSSFGANYLCLAEMYLF